jgi:hypothetical protein
LKGIGDLGISRHHCLNGVNPDIAVAVLIRCVGAINRSVSQTSAISVSIRGVVEILMRTIAACQDQLHTNRGICIIVALPNEIDCRPRIGSTMIASGDLGVSNHRGLNRVNSDYVLAGAGASRGGLGLFWGHREPILAAYGGVSAAPHVILSPLWAI